jgi:hypothetical protein
MTPAEKARRYREKRKKDPVRYNAHKLRLSRLYRIRMSDPKKKRKRQEYDRARYLKRRTDDGGVS